MSNSGLKMLLKSKMSNKCLMKCLRKLQWNKIESTKQIEAQLLNDVTQNTKIDVRKHGGIQAI